MGHARQHSQRVLEKNFWEPTRTVIYHKAIILRVFERKFMKNLPWKYIGNRFHYARRFRLPLYAYKMSFNVYMNLPTTKAGLTLDIYVGKFAAQRRSLPLYLSSSRLFWNLRL